MENGSKTLKSKERNKEKRKPAFTYALHTDHVSIPDKEKRFFTFPKRPYQLWNQVSSVFSGQRVFVRGGKMAGHEAGNSPPSSAVGMQLYPYSPIHHRGVHRDNLTLQFIHLS